MYSYVLNSYILNRYIYSDLGFNGWESKQILTRTTVYIYMHSSWGRGQLGLCVLVHRVMWAGFGHSLPLCVKRKPKRGINFPRICWICFSELYDILKWSTWKAFKWIIICLAYVTNGATHTLNQLFTGQIIEIMC